MRIFSAAYRHGLTANNPSSAPILEHTYRSRLPSASSLIRLFLAHPAPRPSLIYLAEASPPVTVFSIVHSNLLYLSPSDVDTEPLLVLEFLRRVVDVLEEFVGAPLLATKLQTSYDVVAQLLTEMCDSGLVSSTEINSLQENVETPNWMNKFLSGVGLPGLAMDGFAIDFDIANIMVQNIITRPYSA